MRVLDDNSFEIDYYESRSDKGPWKLWSDVENRRDIVEISMVLAHGKSFLKKTSEMKHNMLELIEKSWMEMRLLDSL